MKENCLVKKLKEYVTKNKTVILVTTLVTYITTYLSYYIFVQTGYGSGDSVVEGFWYYHYDNWHLSIGRWCVRYINDLIGKNLVLPHLIVFMYSLIVVIMVLMLKEMFGISSAVTAGLSAAVMIVNTCVISQFEVRYLAVTMALSALLSIIFVLCAKKAKIWADLIGIICVAVFLGLYQSYVSMVAVVTLEVLVVDMIRSESDDNAAAVKTELIYLLRSIIMGLLGGALYFLILKIELKRWNVEAADRLTGFSVAKFFNNLPSGIYQSYRQFFLYFNEIMLSRYILFRILFVITLLSLVTIVVNMIKRRLWGRMIVMCIAGLLLPVGTYLVCILLPGAGLSNNMTYQYVMIIPFVMVIAEYAAKLGYKFVLWVKIASYICVFLIICTYIINANATFRAYELSYNSVTMQLEMILDRVYELDGFKLDETPIITVGVVNDAAVRRTQAEIYQYVIDADMDYNPGTVPSNNGSYHDIKASRYYFITAMLGVDPKYSVDEPMAEVYENIINSDEFKSMPLWPAEGSVAMMDGVAVVKLTDDPPAVD